MPEKPISSIPPASGDGAEPMPDAKSEIENPRIGVYICNCGGNIGDTVACEQVAERLARLPDVVASRSAMFMCSDPGQALITDDIRQQGVNRVVVGACSIFLHEQTFRRTVARAGLNPYLYHHVGLREQDSWVHHAHPQEATEKAERLMAAGIAKARLMRPLEPVQLGAEKHALVVGGGVAGLRAALDIARLGLKVTLLEKSHFLGGHLARLDKVFPTGEDARTLLHGLIEAVLAEPNITIHTGAQMIAAKGYVGNFQISVRQEPRGVTADFAAVGQAIWSCPVEVPDEFNEGLTTRKALYRPYVGSTPPGPVIDWEHCTHCGICLKFDPDHTIQLEAQPVEFEVNVGAVVVATGFRPYEPFPGEFGYGEFPEVVTLPQFERLLANPNLMGRELAWNGHPVRSLVMIHCVGSRQIDGLHTPQPDGRVNEYCSRVCCTATLSAANQVRQRFPKVNVYDVYQDIRTYGLGHEAYYEAASRNRVTFLRYFAEEIPQVNQAAAGDKAALLVTVKDHLTGGEEIELPVDLVVLAVGMQPSPVDELVEMLKISPGSDRFLLEVHPKLRPVETAVTGVVLAGTAQGPMNIQESCAAAEAAAAKVAVLLGRGQVELEPYVARVDPRRCQGSGACVEACPQEDALHLETFTLNGESFQRAVVTPANCNGCGVCVSSCPNRAIDIQGWRLDEYEAMVAALVAKLPEADLPEAKLPEADLPEAVVQEVPA
jgi:heterodisulfide reductase subunit A